MTEEQVFLAALEIADAAERSAFLDKACAGDDDLRQQVEELLTAHFKKGPFLDEPLGMQLEAGSSTPAKESTSSGPANPAGDDVADGKKPDEASDDLPFLKPSSRPDSLGRIGHYEVLEVLGKGGFGIVLRAFDDVLHRVAALKVLAPALAAVSPARKRFLREARLSAQVRHENVVQIYAVEEQPLPYLVMEFIPGESLQQRLDRTGPLEAPEIVRLGRQIAEGLAAAHATGLIHRDIKPGNVLVESERQRVKITDFGLARAADDASLTQSGVLAGTPLYMAPEQAKGEALDHRADLFSLGSVLYVMASGRPPFRAATTYAVLKRVVEDNPRPIREVIPEMPQWLADVIAKLHAKKPEERFQSAREVADIFADCENQLKTNAVLKDLSNIPQSKPAAGRFGGWKWVAAAVVFLPLLALALTELAGATHWLRAQQATTDSAMSMEADYTNSLGMKFMRIPAGKFTMGSAQKDIDHFIELTEDEEYKRMLKAEGPEHEVELTKPFYLGVTEVTVGQFRRFIEANPAYKIGDRWKKPGFEQTDNHPVVWVSWNNAVDFCKWLSAKEGQEYRLPTEAEWEYCCRAGTSGTRYCFGDEDEQLEKYAWYKDNSDKVTHRVAKLKPNPWGLYDMYGNGFEWCLDRYDPNYYQNSPVKDPAGPIDRGLRVQRGGAWNYPSMVCRSAFRSYAEAADTARHRGFRVLLVAPPGGAFSSGGK